MLNLVDDIEKIKIIDKALNALTVDDVKDMFGSDIIVDKLKGVQDRKGPVLQIVEEMQRMANEEMMLRTECQMLKADIQILVRCLNKGLGDPSISGDFSSLKQRHGIY
jgi:hypothetical protein